MKTVALICGVSLLAAVACAQSTQEEQGPLDNLLGGISRTYGWYDVPVYGAYLASRIPTVPGVRLDLPPAEFERNFQRRVGDSDQRSPGSMNKDLIPRAVFGCGLMATLFLDIATDAQVSTDDYTRLFHFHKALVYTEVVTELVKKWTYRERPDGSNGESFFSGHTSTTFAMASFLHLEMAGWMDRWSLTRDDATMRFALKAAAGMVLYGWASYVGWSRIRDDKHYLSDVVTGAAVGTVIGVLIHAGGTENTVQNPVSVELASRAGVPSVCCSIRL